MMNIDNRTAKNLIERLVSNNCIDMLKITLELVELNDQDIRFVLDRIFIKRPKRISEMKDGLEFLLAIPARDYQYSIPISVLPQVCEDNDIESLKLILKWGYDTRSNTHIDVEMHRAAKYGYLELLDVLLNCCVCYPDQIYYQASEIALKNKHYDAVRLIEKKKPSNIITIMYADGEMLPYVSHRLYRALIGCDIEMIKFILEFNIDHKEIRRDFRYKHPNAEIRQLLKDDRKRLKQI